MIRRLVLSMPLILAMASVGDDPRNDAAAVVAILADGLHARAAVARARAATALRALHARPMAEEPDWAARWGGRAAPAYRDRALGPAYRSLTLPPHGRYHLDQTFLAGQRAQVAVMVRPVSAFDLTMAVDGIQVTCGLIGAKKVCDWVPDYTARYAIDLVSQSGVPAEFFVAVR